MKFKIRKLTVAEKLKLKKSFLKTIKVTYTVGENAFKEISGILKGVFAVQAKEKQNSLYGSYSIGKEAPILKILKKQKK